MKKLLMIFTLALVTFSAVAAAEGQTATPSASGGASTGLTPNYALGDVTAIDASNKQIRVKTKVGEVTVLLDDNTKYLRAVPGETTLKNATPITLAEIGIGDRVMARGKVAEDQKSVPARQVIVMSKAAITRKQEHDREEWQRRGIAGTITALNPEAKEITVLVRSREGAQPVIVGAGGNVVFRRYAPDSVKFSNAKASSFSELKVGDQLRALGERSADGTRFAPEEIVSGSFRTVAGTVTAVDTATGEVKINDLQSKHPLTILINQDSMLRRFPAEFGARMGMRAQGGGTGGPGAGPPSQEGERRRPAAGAGAGAEGSRPRMGGGGGFDIERFIERMPELTVAELKPGDMIIVSSTSGADPSRLTAIKLVAGIEPLMRMWQARQGQGRPSAAPGISTGLPGGLADLGIGLP